MENRIGEEKGHRGQKRWVHLCREEHTWPEIMHRQNRDRPLRARCPRCDRPAMLTTVRGRASS